MLWYGSDYLAYSLGVLDVLFCGAFFCIME
jgi:hypothetical protein